MSGLLTHMLCCACFAAFCLLGVGVGTPRIVIRSMRSQGVVVSLISPSADPFPEVCAPDGSTVYSVVNPGDEFHCQVTLLGRVPEDAYHSHVEVRPRPRRIISLHSGNDALNDDGRIADRNGG